MSIYTIATDIVAAAFVGVFIGVWLDKWLLTTPLCLIVCTIIGFAAGFRNITRSRKNEQSSQPPKSV